VAASGSASGSGSGSRTSRKAAGGNGNVFKSKNEEASSVAMDELTAQLNVVGFRVRGLGLEV